ncbi:MAG: quinate 5-dehydrogenase [Armatimonadetes bacterium]|nr:quinate 5-dehydrogenase [Armatimonadota bacterium]MDW8029482.1 quinate 5-dehydrogenase [Armatimonadota bacterium]
MKRVVSVSLGSSKRDKKVEAVFFGERFLIERIGTDGDLRKFAQLLQQLDGKVDAICFGGMDIWVRCGKRKYALREPAKLAKIVKRTPVVDGSGLKDTMEREAVQWLQRNGIVDFRKRKVLLVSAVDRFGMAEEFWNLGADLRVGDLAFGLGIPLLIKSQRVYEFLGSIFLPLIAQLPISWIYPTGKKQEQIEPKFESFYCWAEVIAGDFLLIRKHLPVSNLQFPVPLIGKIILTNTTTKEDVELLRQIGISLLITTTPELDGRTFGTNVMEGLIIAHFQRRPEEFTQKDYMQALKDLGWQPNVRELV